MKREKTAGPDCLSKPGHTGASSSSKVSQSQFSTPKHIRLLCGDPLDARKPTSEGACDASILLMPERPDVGDDGVDIARS